MLYITTIFAHFPTGHAHHTQVEVLKTSQEPTLVRPSQSTLSVSGRGGGARRASTNVRTWIANRSWPCSTTMGSLTLGSNMKLFAVTNKVPLIKPSPVVMYFTSIFTNLSPERLPAPLTSARRSLLLEERRPAQLLSKAAFWNSDKESCVPKNKQALRTISPLTSFSMSTRSIALGACRSPTFVSAPILALAVARSGTWRQTHGRVSRIRPCH